MKINFKYFIRRRQGLWRNFSLPVEAYVFIKRLWQANQQSRARYNNFKATGRFTLITLLISYQIGYSKNKGLEWGDNSCYFDASIQALSHINDFNKDLSDYNPVDSPPTSLYLNLINAINGKFTSTNDYLKSDYKIEDSITLREFHLGFSRELEPKNQPTGQKDAPEFILKILSEIEKTIPSLKEKAEKEIKQNSEKIGLRGKDLEGSVQAQLNQLHNPFDKIDFHTRNQKICSICKHTTETPDNQRFLILQIESTTSVKIEDLLKINFADHQISDYLCPNCHKKCICSDIKKMASLPKYLIIQLSRNEPNLDRTGKIILDSSKKPTYKKNLTPVTFGFEINLDDINTILANDLNTELSHRPSKYNLLAMVVHGGSTVFSGHYWAYGKDKDNNWWRYDDEIVSDGTEQRKKDESKINDSVNDILKAGIDNQATPYMLFYELVDAGKAATQEDEDEATKKALEEVNSLKTQLDQLQASLMEPQTKLQTLEAEIRKQQEREADRKSKEEAENPEPQKKAEEPIAKPKISEEQKSLDNTDLIVKQKLGQLKVSLQKLETKLQTLQEKMGTLRRRLV